MGAKLVLAHWIKTLNEGGVLVVFLVKKNKKSSVYLYSNAYDVETGIPYSWASLIVNDFWQALYLYFVLRITFTSEFFFFTRQQKQKPRLQSAPEHTTSLWKKYTSIQMI